MDWDLGQLQALLDDGLELLDPGDLVGVGAEGGGQPELEVVGSRVAKGLKLETIVGGKREKCWKSFSLYLPSRNPLA